MFCPRCSQQQLPGEMRYCSRCGFQLAAVAQLLNTNGMSFVQANPPTERLPLIKRKELRTGAKLIFTSFFLIIPCAILTGILDNGFPLLLIPITFLLGLAQVLYYFFFGESILPVGKQNQPLELNENTHQFHFQPSYDAPFSYMDSNRVKANEYQPHANDVRRTSNLYDGR